jgi:PAS domain S-box-containing protein
MRRLLERPVFPSEEQTQRAAMIHTIAWSTMKVVPPVMVAIMIVLPGALVRGPIVIAFVTLLGLLLLVVNQRGHTRAAALLLVGGLLLLITALSFTSGGFQSPVLTGFLVVILIAGLLLGDRAGMLTGLLCVAIGLALAIAQRFEVLPPSAVHHTSMSLWLGNVLFIALIIVVQRLAGRVMRNALYRAEAELAERSRAEQRLQLALEAGEISVWDRSLSTHEVIGDERLFELYGVPATPDKVVSQDVWAAHIHPDDFEAQQSALGGLAGKPGRARTEFRIVRPDGTTRHIQAAAATVLDDTGKAVSIVGMNIDITDQKLAERERERLVHDLKERVKELGLLHATARLLQTERPFNRELLADLVPLLPGGWQYPECCEARIAYGELAVTTPGWRITPWMQSQTFGDRGMIEVAYLEPRPLEAEGPFLAEERALLTSLTEMLGVYLDRQRAAEERVRLESQLRQSHKMEALGTLAGGIAHDFNNILAAISGNAQLALDDLADHPARESVVEIGEAGQRAADLVRRILVFSRRKETQRRVIALQPVTEEAMRLLRASLPAMVQIRTAYAPHLPPVLADSTEVHQIIMNLGTNAGHALGDAGGVLTVSVDQIEIDESSEVRSAELQAGSYVRITVSDNGCGMSDDIVQRIFEPFFTTKGPERGTGLGLSVVHGIVRSHKGAITVQSQPGLGTTIRVYFPAVAAVAETRRASVKMVRANGECVMHVDDEAPLVHMMTRLLERLGYTAAGFTDAQLALEAFRANPHRFHAVVTDMAMPEMTGRELAREMLAIRPELPIALMSGYLTKEDGEEAVRAGIRTVLEKPCQIEEIALAVHGLVSSAHYSTAPQEQAP